MGMLQYSSMDRRFFHKLGATQLERTLCSSAGKAGIKATLGGSYGMDPGALPGREADLIWGSNPITSNLHFWSRAQEAKRRGAKARRHRSLSQPDGGEMHAAHRAAAGHRRRARAGHDARAGRRRA
jgi:anaerobic selenocysteine-containing dehydrogenase